MLKVKRSGEFTRNLDNLDQDISDLAEDKIVLFSKNPDDTRLKNHKLKSKMKGKWALSITGDIRIIYIWESKTVVRFLAIGGHRKVYRRL